MHATDAPSGKHADPRQTGERRRRGDRGRGIPRRRHGEGKLPHADLGNVRCRRENLELSLIQPDGRAAPRQPDSGRHDLGRPQHRLELQGHLKVRGLGRP